MREPGPHTCQVVPAAKTIVDEALERMRKRAQEETVPITKIYMEEVLQTRMNNPGFCTGFHPWDTNRLKIVGSIWLFQKPLS